MTGPQNVAAQMSATNGAMQNIISSASAGQFQVTPEAGDELIKIFQEYGDYLEKRLTDMDVVKNRTPLGNSPAGMAMADFNERVAVGDEDSFESMIQQGRELSPKVIDAIKKGIALYQQVDDGSATHFNSQGQQ